MENQQRHTGIQCIITLNSMENQQRHTETTMYHHNKFNGESTKAHRDDNVSSQ